jgi:hypothetical protein
MSEYNDGGFADRGNTPGSAGGVAQPGGSNSSSSSNQGGFGLGGSGIGVGGYNFTSAFNGGELNPGVQAGVPAFSGFANAWGAGVPRRDQTLGDIQHQNAAANAAAAQSGSSNAGNTSIRSRTPTFRTVRRRNPTTGVVETIQIPVPQPPVPQPKPPVPGWFGVPPFTPENLPQDYFTHIPGVPLGPQIQPPAFDPNWPGFNTPPNDPSLPDFGVGGQYQTGVPGAITNGGTTGGPQVGGKDQSQVKDQSRLQFGGPVAPGRSYTVGENGPERFVPRQPGIIVPNRKDMGGFLSRMQNMPPRPRPVLTRGFGGGNMGFPIGRI